MILSLQANVLCFSLFDRLQGFLSVDLILHAQLECLMHLIALLCRLKKQQVLGVGSPTHLLRFLLFLLLLRRPLGVSIQELRLVVKLKT